MVEKELEKTLAQKPLDVAQTGDNIHEFQKRVCVAERAKDDAVVKLEGLTVKNRMLEAKCVKKWETIFFISCISLFQGVG